MTYTLTPFADDQPTADELDALPTHAELVDAHGLVVAVNTSPDSEDDDETWLASTRVRGNAGWSTSSDLAGELRPGRYRARVADLAELVELTASDHLLAFAERIDLDAFASGLGDYTLDSIATLRRAASVVADLGDRVEQAERRSRRGEPAHTEKGDPEQPEDLF